MIIQGDCLATLRGMASDSVDSIVTDPPYGLGKAPDAVAMLRDWLDGERHETGGAGFMGQRWDAFVPGPEVWRECLRVLKPGGHATVFAGSRTVDLMGLALRIAGFEIRDQIQWLYGSGFPKSLDVGKAIDKAAGAEREVVGADPSAAGWGTALKPAHEPVVLARKPLVGTVARNVLEHGTGAINVDGCRVATDESLNGGAYSERTVDATSYGLGSTCKSFEQPQGRWPANVILDAEAGAMLGDQARFFYCPKASRAEREAGLDDLDEKRRTDGRTKDIENPRLRTSPRRNTHPTVKPVDLMRYLVRLVTPPGGLVLDPFAGSGTTGIAAALEGMRFLGCELSQEYIEIAERRIAHWQAQ